MSDHPKSAGRPPVPDDDGFSLIELVMVLSLIAILAAITLPDLRLAMYRSKRVEAQLGLKGIFVAQRAFYAENGFYADNFDQLGMNISGGRQLDEQTITARYYTYSLRAAAGGTNFFAMAAGDINPGNNMTDVVVIQDGITIVE